MGCLLGGKVPYGVEDPYWGALLRGVVQEPYGMQEPYRGALLMQGAGLL